MEGDCGFSGARDGEMERWRDGETEEKASRKDFEVQQKKREERKKKREGSGEGRRGI
jgi:hypothetical protein